MNLALDMGNTRIKWRLRDDSGKVARGYLQSNTPWPELASTLRAALSGFGVDSFGRVLVASVLSDMANREFQRWCESEFTIIPEFARSQAVAGNVTNGYRVPERLGVDRWLAILAGYARVHQACVIADCGSALTVDLVDGRGRHLGGYIAPGLQIMRSALRMNTEGVVVDDLSSGLTFAPGRDTESAVNAAQSAMICGLIERALLQMPAATSAPRLLLTGGDAERLLSYFPASIWEPELVLDGLELAFPHRLI